MDNSLSIALSGQAALSRRLDTIAQNIANATTTGYRAEGIRFETAVQQAGRDRLSFATSGDTFIANESGSIVPTGNSLDVAINGSAFFAHETPSGTVYSRDGRMSVSIDGQLVTLQGDAILDAGGAPIGLNRANGEISISRDGMITQNGAQIGAIGLFEFAQNAKLDRQGSVAFVSDQQPEPVLDFSRTSMMQGHIEQSNVNPLTELTRMIAVSRSFETAQNMIKTAEDASIAGIRALGPSS